MNYSDIETSETSQIIFEILEKLGIFKFEDCKKNLKGLIVDFLNFEKSKVLVVKELFPVMGKDNSIGKCLYIYKEENPTEKCYGTPEVQTSIEKLKSNPSSSLNFIKGGINFGINDITEKIIFTPGNRILRFPKVTIISRYI